MKKHLFLFFVGTMLLQLTFAQDSVYVRNTIEHLASKNLKEEVMWPKRFESRKICSRTNTKKRVLLRLVPMDFFSLMSFRSYIPRKSKSRLNNRPLNTGIDYIVYANAPAPKAVTNWYIIMTNH